MGFFSERACIHDKSQVNFLQNKAADGPSADPAASLHLNPLFLFPPFQALPCSSVVLSPDAGGTLVLVFIPTWLTNRLFKSHTNKN